MMIFSWLKNLRRRRLLKEPFPAAWEEHLAANVRHFAHLQPDQQAAVRRVVRVMAAEKHWVGGGRFEVTDEMKVTVAAQSALLLLGFADPYYFDRVQSIILYPRQYVQPPEFQRGYLVVRENVPVLGEAWHRGPIVVSWEDVLEAGRDAGNGKNVVLHEFAHHIDGLNGDMDGTPPLAGREQQRVWHRVTEAEYRRLVGSARREEVTLLDQYGATNRAEFFAVATECFFERPSAMRDRHAELYEVLRQFYRQDPARWLPDARVAPGESLSGGRGPRASEAGQQPAEARGAEEDLDPKVLRSTDADALFTLGVDCANRRKYAAAEAAFSRAIALGPSDAEAYQHRASVRVKLGKYREALADCQESLRRQPDEPAAYLARGAAYVGLRQFDQAKQDLDRALGEMWDDAEAYYLRGLACAGLGDLRRAVRDFTRSIAREPYAAEAYFHRARAYRELGLQKKAQADLEQAFQLDPRVDQPRGV